MNAKKVSRRAFLSAAVAVSATATTMPTILADAGYRVLALSPRGRTALASVDRDGPLALLLGSE